MNNKNWVVLPSHAYEIILEILEGVGLKEKNEKIYEKINQATTSEEIVSLKRTLPSIIIAETTREIKNGLSDEEAITLLSEKLELEKADSEQMLDKIKKKLVAFSKITGNGEKKEDDIEEAVKLNGIREEAEENSDRDFAKEKNDVYREPIE